ncbi:hypothetical protein MNEG_9049 [Monoraphidium neglectum]|uniref:Uncharacterized protein n=1 Tax=Monoraphidium neglectum TaxID=145388 RepID=A0A0D2MXD9_9CHLO|nr:hypothetical protein MNEG_9049 [Monoraphidium neglectum]KIY98915.1 hypothetical protein MNEG_9049 [Monoraphidium neglectum]|eukprot:XP_013897935.1 hypothetical protein MNEG_9049 [Monoraphidium neglectum]
MSLQTKRAFLGDVNPGREYKEPRIYQEPRHEEPSSAGEAFLDARGGDHDDCATLQQLVDRAIETEANTGPAQPAETYGPGGSCSGGGGGGSAAAAGPSAARDAGGGAAAEDDDYDPLEAFMSEIHEEVAANKPAPPGARPDAALACDDEADPAAEYMAVRQAAGGLSAAQAIAADVAAAGYDSDEEVYATAKALQDQGGGGGDDEVRPCDAGIGAGI